MKDLNFFTPYQGQKKEKADNNRYIYGAAAFAGIIIMSTLLFNSTKMFLLNREIKRYAEELGKTEIQEELKEADKLNNQITVLKEYDTSLMDVAKSIGERDNVSTELLISINSTLPSETVFKNMSVVNNTVAIQGTSTNRKSIAELQHNLKELSNMDDVFVSSIDNSGAVQGEYSFEIKCVLKDVD